MTIDDFNIILNFSSTNRIINIHACIHIFDREFDEVSRNNIRIMIYTLNEKLKTTK